MKYLICDDSEEFTKDLSSRIKEIEPDSIIETFQTSADLSFHIQEIAGDVDAIFMDIQLNGTNGIDTASKINKSYPSIKIVYVTGYGEQYAEKIFMCQSELTPVSYLVKPIKDLVLKNALNRLKEKPTTQCLVPLKIEKSVTYINSDKIQYISVTGRKLSVFTDSDILEFNGRLSEYLNLLPDWFIRCHRSYCVNIHYIEEIIKYQEIIMKNGDKVPVGRNYADDFREAVTLRHNELGQLKG
ncbi:MAG: LytR/AlgR family response regulator transcription factor [Oscillospiraceae bacterium]